MAEFVIPIQELTNAPKRFTFSIRHAWLEQELAGTDLSAAPDSREGTLALEATLSGDDVLLQGHAEATLTVPCARCLSDVPLALRADMTTFMVARGRDQRPAPDEDALSPEEFVREFFSGDRIVLDELVRENLILEVPMQTHCTEAACVARWESPAADSARATPFSALESLRAKNQKGN